MSVRLQRPCLTRTAVHFECSGAEPWQRDHPFASARVVGENPHRWRLHAQQKRTSVRLARDPQIDDDHG
jgi:hypothetical protein